jgi:hypothetical protein
MYSKSRYLIKNNREKKEKRKEKRESKRYLPSKIAKKAFCGLCVCEGEGGGIYFLPAVTETQPPWSLLNIGGAS